LLFALTTDGVTEIFHCHETSGRTMALGLTQPPTEMSTRNIVAKGGQCVGLQPYHLHVPIVLKCGSLRLLEPSGPVQACNGIGLCALATYSLIFLKHFSELQIHYILNY
jgi:hypothetical protein